MRHKNGGVVIDCPYDGWCENCRYHRTRLNASWIKESDPEVCDCSEAVVAKLPLEGEGSYRKGKTTAKYINADQFLADESEAFMKAQIQLARSSKDITYRINEVVHQKIQRLIADAPDEAVTEVVFCKDCIKHNIDIGDFKDEHDNKNRFYWKDEACPLVRHRGKAQGHEFDYQYCSCGRRKDDEKSD